MLVLTDSKYTSSDIKFDVALDVNGDLCVSNRGIDLYYIEQCFGRIVLYRLDRMDRDILDPRIETQPIDGFDEHEFVLQDPPVVPFKNFDWHKGK